MKTIIANWKMNPQTLQEAEELLSSVMGNEVNKVDLVICPPFVYLERMQVLLKDKDKENLISLGAQNCHWEDKGAFTGEVSASMLKNLGISYVIIGHSERRWKMLETDEMINKKIKTILKHGLTPILAVGEKKREGNYRDMVTNQLTQALAGIDPNDIKKIIIAYEPVWAIGTGIYDKPEDTVEMVDLIRDYLSKLQISDFKVLYGGSVNSGNIADFVLKADIDGVLVGGASINQEEFKGIIKIVSNI